MNIGNNYNRIAFNVSEEGFSTATVADNGAQTIIPVMGAFRTQVAAATLSVNNFKIELPTPTALRSRSPYSYIELKGVIAKEDTNGAIFDPEGFHTEYLFDAPVSPVFSVTIFTNYLNGINPFPLPPTTVLTGNINIGSTTTNNISVRAVISETSSDLAGYVIKGTYLLL